MNTTAIQESRKAIEQSERMKKLAMLALIFAPLAFATSIFSMNVVELQELRVWHWLVTTVALLSAALLFYRLDMQFVRLTLGRAWPLSRRRSEALAEKVGNGE